MTNRRTFRPRRPLLVAVGALALFAAACGSDGGDTTGAELPNASSQRGGESAPSSPEGDRPTLPSEAEMSRTLEQYRDCLVEKLPSGSEVNIDLVDGETNIGIDTDGDSIAAEEACQPIIAELEQVFAGDPEQVAEQRDIALKVQVCMAEKGFEIEVAADGGIDTEVNDDDAGQEYDQLAYEDAEEACFLQAEGE